MSDPEKIFDHPAITTDVIVGFRERQRKEFAVTKEYLKRIHFYEMHIFQYSKREGTKAAVMGTSGSGTVKKEGAISFGVREENV